MGVNTKELLLGMICTGWECVSVVRGFEEDGVDWEKVVTLRRGILGRGLGGSVHLCAAKCTK